MAASRSSLRLRLFVVFSVLFATVLSVIVQVALMGIPWLEWPGLVQLTQTHELSRLNVAADLKKSAITVWLKERRANLEVLSNSASLRRLLASRTDEAAAAILAKTATNYVDGYVGLEALAIVLPDQKAIAAAGPPELRAIILSKVGADQFSPGEIETLAMVAGGPDRRSPHLLVFRQVLGASGEVIGLIGGLLDPAEILASLAMQGQREWLGGSSEAFFVNEDRLLLTPLKFHLADGSEAQPLVTRIDTEAVRMAVQGSEGAQALADYRGVQALVAYRHLRLTPDLGWGLVLKVDQDEALGPLRRSVRQIILIAVTGFVLVLAASAAIATRLSRPLTAMVDAVREVKQGNFAVALRAEGPNEFVELADSFNDMARQLAEWHERFQTELTARTADLRQMVDRLTEVNTELERFAYVASHDLQEPLRTIASFSQLLERRYKGKLDGDADEYIGFIVGAAKRMHVLINDLLAYSRITGKSRGFAPVSSAAACQTALSNLQNSITETQARITVGELPPVLGDEVELMQLFQNLIGNAIKFRRPGAVPEIRVDAERREVDGAKMWEFRVTDNGIGMEPGHADVFEIFRRVHSGYPGSGVGLAICKRIVQRHGGQIRVRSVLDQGSVFLFTIPVLPEDENSAPPTVQAAPPRPVAPAEK